MGIKITNAGEDQPVPFNVLNSGGTFTLKYGSKYVFLRIDDVSNGPRRCVNAVRIPDGAALEFSGDEMVYPIKCSLTVEK